MFVCLFFLNACCIDKQELEVLSGEDGHLTGPAELVWIRAHRVISAYQKYVCACAQCCE